MSSPCEVTAPSTAAAPMSFFERYLTAWVALCIVIGIALGQGMPGVFKAIGEKGTQLTGYPAVSVYHEFR